MSSHPPAMDAVSRAFGNGPGPAERTSKSAGRPGFSLRGGRMSGEEPEGAEGAAAGPGDDGGLKSLVERAHAELEKAGQSAIAALHLTGTTDDAEEQQPARVELLEALDAFQRSASAAVERLAEGSGNVARLQVRKKENWMNMKLETLRNATKTKLKQQEIKLAAVHKRELAEKIRGIGEGGLGEQLAEAVEARSRLEAELKAALSKGGTLEATTTALREKLEAAAAEATQREHAVERLTAEGEVSRKQLSVAKETLKASKDELNQQREQIGAMQAQLAGGAEQASRVDRLQSEVLAALSARDAAEAAQKEAEAEAARLRDELARGAGFATDEAETLRRELSIAQSALEAQREELAMSHQELEARDAAMAALAVASQENHRREQELQKRIEAAEKAAEAAAEAARADLAAGSDEAEKSGGQQGAPSLPILASAIDPEEVDRRVLAATEALGADLAASREAQWTAEARLSEKGKEADGYKATIAKIETMHAAELRRLGDAATEAKGEVARLNRAVATLETRLKAAAAENARRQSMHQAAAGEGEGGGVGNDGSYSNGGERERLEQRLKAVLSSADYYWTKTMTLEDRVLELVRRYKIAMETLEKTTEALNKMTRAMEKQQAAMEKAGKASREEKKALVSTALSSLQHLRTHLLATLGNVYDLSGKSSSAPPRFNLDVSLKARALKGSGSLPAIASPYSTHVRTAQLSATHSTGRSGAGDIVAVKQPMPGGGVPLGYALHLVRPSHHNQDNPAGVGATAVGASSSSSPPPFATHHGSAAAAIIPSLFASSSSVMGRAHPHASYSSAPPALRDASTEALVGRSSELGSRRAGPAIAPMLGVLRHTAAGFERQTSDRASSERSPGSRGPPQPHIHASFSSPSSSPSPRRRGQFAQSPLYTEHLVHAYETSRREAIKILVAESMTDAGQASGRIKPALLRKWANDSGSQVSEDRSPDRSPNGGLGQMRLAGERATHAAMRARESALAAAAKAAEAHEELDAVPPIVPPTTPYAPG